MSIIRVGLLSGVLLLSGGCFLQKKPKVQIPVAVPPAPVAAAPAPTVVPEQPAQVQTAPVTPPPTQPTTQSPPPTESGKPSPFPPVTRPQTPTRSNPSTPAAVTPPSVAPPVSPTPAPALGAMLSADERKQLEGAYQSDLNQANSNLGRLSGRGLSPEQQDSVSRARAWIRQAAQYRGRDLATAAELVRRARVLTQDLASALK